jgi:hypothetical protein
MARFISVKENGRFLYFEISPTGALILPPDLNDGNAPQPAAQTEPVVRVRPPELKVRPAYQFIGFFDENKIKEFLMPPVRLPVQVSVPGYSIQDLLAGPIVR